MFTAGGGVVIPGRKTQLGDALIKHKVTHLSVVSTQVQILLSVAKHRKYLKKMNAILVGGSMVGEQLKLDMVKHQLPFHLTYGLTEMSSQVATTRRIESYQDFDKAEVLEYAKIWIDPKFNIWVAGETLFKGYVVDGRVRSRLNKDGFFRTGDIGRSYLIKYLRVSGRADNMFISGGENVYPEQIEQALMRISGVIQAVVVPVPNEHYGHRPVAVVKFRENKRLPAQKLSKFLALNIEKYKVPDQYVIWPKEEGTSRLKISRAELLDYVLNHQNSRNIIR
jgi:O-succinylbenzoic acid--CoA ligase